MKLTKKVQYGVLLVQHITENGRSHITTASEKYFVPKSFLEQIGRSLRLAGILRSVRGPGGGYEVIGEPTLLDVTKALDPRYLGTRANIEGKVLNEFSNRVSSAINSALKVKFADIKKNNVQSKFSTPLEAVNLCQQSLKWL